MVVSSVGPMAPRLQVYGLGTEWSDEEETGVNPLRRILTGEDVEVSPDLRAWARLHWRTSTCSLLRPELRT